MKSQFQNELFLKENYHDDFEEEKKTKTVRSLSDVVTDFS